MSLKKLKEKFSKDFDEKFKCDQSKDGIVNYTMDFGVTPIEVCVRPKDFKEFIDNIIDKSYNQGFTDCERLPKDFNKIKEKWLKEKEDEILNKICEINKIAFSEIKKIINK